MEVKSEMQKGEEVQATHAGAADTLSELEGIGPKTADLLVKGGMTDLYRIAECKPEDLMTLQGIGEKTAGKIIQSAQNYVKTHPK